MKSNKMIIFIFALLVSLPLLSTDIFLPSLPLMQKEFGISEILSKFTLVVYMIGFAISILLFGIISDRFGRKPCIIVALFIFILSSIGCYFSTDIYTLILFRFFQGIGAGSGTVLVRAMIRDKYNLYDSIPILAIIASTMTVSTLLAPIIGAYLTQLFGWRSTFIFLIIFSIFLFIWTIIKLQETLIKLNYESLIFKVIVSRVKECLSNKNFLKYTLTISLVWTSFFVFIIESVYIYKDIFDLSTTQFGIVYGVISFGYIIGNILTSKLIKKQIVSDRIITYGLMMSIFTLVILLIVNVILPNIFLFTLGIFLFLIGCGLVVPNCQGSVLNNFSHIIGLAASIFYFIEMTTAGLISGISNYMNLSINSILILMLSCLILSYIIFNLLNANRKI